MIINYSITFINILYNLMFYLIARYYKILSTFEKLLFVRKQIFVLLIIKFDYILLLKVFFMSSDTNFPSEVFRLT